MNHIKGIGVDITKISRFLNIINKYENNFIHKILHINEIGEYNKISNINIKSRFLASRWSYKEALVKATGNKKIIFTKVYLEKNNEGK